MLQPPFRTDRELLHAREVVADAFRDSKGFESWAMIQDLPLLDLWELFLITLYDRHEALPAWWTRR